MGGRVAGGWTRKCDCSSGDLRSFPVISLKDSKFLSRVEVSYNMFDKTKVVANPDWCIFLKNLLDNKV